MFDAYTFAQPCILVFLFDLGTRRDVVNFMSYSHVCVSGDGATNYEMSGQFIWSSSNYHSFNVNPTKSCISYPFWKMGIHQSCGLDFKIYVFHNNVSLSPHDLYGWPHKHILHLKTSSKVKSSPFICRFVISFKVRIFLYHLVIG